MRMFYNNGNESIKTDDVKQAQRVWIGKDECESDGVAFDSSGQVKLDDAKLLQVKARLGFEGDIRHAKSGDGVVIHKAIAELIEDTFTIGNLLAKPVK